jgi:hypothetical protein
VLFLALFCIYVHNIFLKYTKKCVLTFNFSCSLLPQNLEIIYECIRSVKSVYILLHSSISELGTPTCVSCILGSI